MARSQLFLGTKEGMFLSCSAACLADCEYLCAGQITALSLVHEGPGLGFMSPVFMMLWSRAQIKYMSPWRMYTIPSSSPP